MSGYRKAPTIGMKQYHVATLGVVPLETGMGEQANKLVSGNIGETGH